MNTSTSTHNPAGGCPYGRFRLNLAEATVVNCHPLVSRHSICSSLTGWRDSNATDTVFIKSCPWLAFSLAGATRYQRADIKKCPKHSKVKIRKCRPSAWGQK